MSTSKDSENQGPMDHFTEVSYEGTCHCKAEYRFGSHTIKIFFCGICGANVYNKSVNPKFRYGQCAINMRLVHDIDLETIEISKGDGKNIHLPPLEENAI
ncbi:hypothetical protein N7522_003477 [Penicillium canescens]|nr:hypothetical protein N7522_003477 [Penicillium canescens]